MKNLIIALLLVTSNAIAQKFATPEERKIVNDFLAKSIGTQVGDGVCRSLIDSAVAQYSGVRNMSELLLDIKLFSNYLVTSIDSLKNLDIIWFYNLLHIDSEDSLSVQYDDERINHIAFARRNLGNSVIRVTDQNPFYTLNREEDLSKYFALKDKNGKRDGEFTFIKLPTKSELIKISKKYLLANK